MHVALTMRPAESDFAPLTIVRCNGCGYLYNRDFDPELIDRMYGDTPLTNIPVAPHMIDRLQGLLDWIGKAHYAGKRVLEIGGGSGHFAFALARTAREVTVYEPCLQLPPASVTNVTIVRSTFPGRDPITPVDFVACRQVIEHVVSPVDTLKAMRSVLVPDGMAYIEMPLARYIEEHASAIDFTLQHVHYFSEAHFRAMAAQAGFVPVKTMVTPDGHDFGFLLRVSEPEPMARPAGSASADTLAARLAEKIGRGQRRLAGLDGTIALYGANSLAQGTLKLFCEGRRIAAVFDDNDCYAGYGMYNASGVVPIFKPERTRLDEIDAIIIAAYLHDRVIAGKLRAAGYRGRILTMRAERPTDAREPLERLLDD